MVESSAPILLGSRMPLRTVASDENTNVVTTMPLRTPNRERAGGNWQPPDIEMDLPVWRQQMKKGDGGDEQEKIKYLYLFTAGDGPRKREQHLRRKWRQLPL